MVGVRVGVAVGGGSGGGVSGGGTGVFVGGTGVSVGGIGVGVGGSGVFVGGTGVSVGSSGVFVAGPDVTVGHGVSVGHGAWPTTTGGNVAVTSKATVSKMAILRKRIVSLFILFQDDRQVDVKNGWSLTSPKPIYNSVHHYFAVCQVRQPLERPGEEDRPVVAAAALVACGIGLTGTFPTER